jgi:hypothetical protein
MNILQVSSTDLIGQRFNGQYISQYFNKQGHQSTHLVWTKEGDDPNTHEMIPIPGVRTFEKVMARVEDHLSIRGVLHPSSFLLSREKAFKASDVVHYHLFDTGPAFFNSTETVGLDHS